MWIQIALWIASLVLSYVLRQSTHTKPPTAGQVSTTTAEEGREIPVLFGTRDIDGPNIVWYGNIRTKPVKSGSGGKKG